MGLETSRVRTKTPQDLPPEGAAPFPFPLGADPSLPAPDALPLGRPPFLRPLLLWGALPLGALLLSFAVGRYPISPGQLLHALETALTASDASAPSALDTVLFRIRLPRILAALFGTTLAPISCSKVDLFITQNEGTSWSNLAVSQPNSGAATVTLPGRRGRSAATARPATARSAPRSAR